MMPLIQQWVWFSAGCAVLGWTFSLMGQLGAALYLTACGLMIPVGLWAWLKHGAPSIRPGQRCRWRRYRKFFPGMFVALAIVSFLGGVTHAPANYDGLSYRLPRVLDWLATGAWHWIPCDPQRLNTRGTGLEWISAFVIALTGTDRFVFLANWVAYLCMPTLIFKLYRGLGLSGRTAWLWMWTWPAAYGYVLQAGGIGNDLLGSVFFLTAIVFALEAKRNHSLSSFGVSVLAMALATNVKFTNVLLGLPWLVAIVSVRSTRVWRRPALLWLIPLAFLSSALPNMIANVLVLADPTGLAGEANLTLDQPLVGLAGNLILLIVGSLQPPVLLRPEIFDGLVIGLIPEGLLSSLRQQFEQGFAFGMREMPGEEGAGIGLFVGLLIMAFGLAGLCSGRSHRKRREPRSLARAIVAVGLFSLVVYMGKVGMMGASRLVLPWYPLLGALVLFSTGAERLARTRLSSVLAGIAQLVALLLVLLTPARPLLPMTELLAYAQRSLPGKPALVRAEKVYQTYANRPYALQPLLERIPPKTRLVGLLGTGDELETSLWRPFGERRVVRLRRPHGTADEASFPAWVIANGEAIRVHLRTTPPAWRETHGLVLVAAVDIQLRATGPPSDWYVFCHPSAMETGTCTNSVARLGFAR